MLEVSSRFPSFVVAVSCFQPVVSLLACCREVVVAVSSMSSYFEDDDMMMAWLLVAVRISRLASLATLAVSLASVASDFNVGCCWQLALFRLRSYHF